MKIGQKIEISRREKHLSQSDLAQKTGINRALISQYENGKVVKIGVDNLNKIALATEKPLSFFMETQEGGGLDSDFLCQYQHLLGILATMDKDKIKALITLLR